jgi:CubicO group peptidase (beta-lactamase class C family)
MRTRFTFLFILILFTFSAKAQEDDLNLTPYVDSLFNQYFNNQTPGAAVAISLNGESVLSRQYGLANLEYNIPVTDTTKFHLTSGSKQFTAYAILKLEQKKMLSLEDEIKLYLPKLPDFGYPITIKQLLTHTSGIRQETQLEHITGYWKGQVMTQARALELIYSQTELNFEPGTKFNYSNSGYTLLAEIIKNITKEPFESWMKENVFLPIGMTNTSISDNYAKVITNRAESYDKNKDGFYRDSGGLWQFYGGTGVYSCSSDLIRWLTYLDNPPEKDKPVISRMEQQATLANGQSIVWGLGLIINEGVKKQRKIWHPGDSPGYHAWIGRYPDISLGMVILTNLDSFQPEYTADDIANKLISDVEQIDNYREKGDNLNFISNPDEITGWYKTDPMPFWYISDLWRISESEKILYFHPGNDAKIKLVKTSNSEYQLSDMPLRLRFQRSNNKKKITLILRGPDGDQHAQKISNHNFQFHVSSAIELVGKYYSPELKTEYEIFFEGTKIKVRHNSPFVNRRWYEFELEPIKKDLFRSDRAFFTYVQFIRDSNKKVIGLKMTNKSDRVQNLWFEKIQ